jgi:hypothetical protein
MFTNWTSAHWQNLAMFVLGLLLTGLGAVDEWGKIPLQITPQSVAGFGVAVLGYLRSVSTDKPRESVLERRNDLPQLLERKPTKDDV